MRARYVAVALACVVLCGVVLVLIASRRPSPPAPRDFIRDELARIKSAGEPVTMADLAGPKIPDEQNGAVIYEKAFRLLPKDGSADEKITDSLIEARVRPEHSKLWDEARRVVGNYSDVISLVEQAVAMPKCRFRVDWQRGENAAFEHVGKLRGLVRTLTAAGLLDAEAGRMDRSARAFLLALQTAEAMSEEWTLGPWAFRIGMIRTAMQGLRAGRGHGALSEAQCKALFDQLARADLSTATVRAMHGQRALGIWVFDQIRNASSKPVRTGEFDPQEYRNQSPELVDADEAFYLSRMKRFVSAGRQSYRSLKASGRLQGLDENVPSYALFSSIGCMTPHFLILRDRAAADIGLTQVLLAAHACRNRFGAYPTSLRDLESRLGWKIRKDPFSGRDFVYKRRGKGFVVYSVGQDLKDNGGAPGEDTSDAETKGDIVLSWPE